MGPGIGLSTKDTFLFLFPSRLTFSWKFPHLLKKFASTLFSTLPQSVSLRMGRNLGGKQLCIFACFLTLPQLRRKISQPIFPPTFPLASLGRREGEGCVWERWGGGAPHERDRERKKTLFFLEEDLLQTPFSPSKLYFWMGRANTYVSQQKLLWDKVMWEMGKKNTCRVKKKIGHECTEGKKRSQSILPTLYT